MKYIVTGDEMKEYDNNTIEHIGTPALELMENAAKALFSKVMNLDRPHQKVLIVCGIGNNGGDGLALARLLLQEDKDVTVCIVGKLEKATESFAVQWKRLEELSPCFISKEDLINSDKDTYDVIVDALFGVG